MMIAVYFGLQRQGAPIKSSLYNHLLITHQRFQLIICTNVER